MSDILAEAKEIIKGVKNDTGDAEWWFSPVRNVLGRLIDEYDELQAQAKDHVETHCCYSAEDVVSREEASEIQALKSSIKRLEALNRKYLIDIKDLQEGKYK